MKVLQSRSNKKAFHKSVNTNEEKYAIDETEDEEPSVIDNPVINELIYFNLFKCGKNFLNNLDTTYEQSFMANSNGK